MTFSNRVKFNDSYMLGGVRHIPSRSYIIYDQTSCPSYPWTAVIIFQMNNKILECIWTSAFFDFIHFLHIFLIPSLHLLNDVPITILCISSVMNRRTLIIKPYEQGNCRCTFVYSGLGENGLLHFAKMRNRYFFIKSICVPLGAEPFWTFVFEKYSVLYQYVDLLKIWAPFY